MTRKTYAIGNWKMNGLLANLDVAEQIATVAATAACGTGLCLPAGATSDNTFIAYEPVPAIGTGLTPGTDEIAKPHGFIRSKLPDPALSILYGGSVTPSNAAEIFALADVDSGLVGGASLTAEKFVPIIQALEATL